MSLSTTISHIGLFTFAGPRPMFEFDACATDGFTLCRIMIANAMETRKADGNEFVAKRKVVGHGTVAPPVAQEVISVQEQEKRRIEEIMAQID